MSVVEKTGVCYECQATVIIQSQLSGKDKIWDWPKNDPAEKVEHWLTCPADKNKRLRIRRGKEPGSYPLSVSRFIAWKQCRARYKRIYLDGEKEAVGDAAEFGRSVHEFLTASLTDAPIPQLYIPLDFADEWRRVQTLLFDMLGNPLSPHGALVDWEALASVAHRRVITWKDGDLDIVLEGELDWFEIFDDRIRITDAKTGWKVARDRDALEEDVQARVYAWMMADEFPLYSDFEFRQLQLRKDDRASGPFVSRTFSREEIDSWVVAFKSEVHRLVTDTDFTPNPACTYCPPGAHAVQLQPFQRFEIKTANDTIEIFLEPIQDAATAQTAAAAALVADGIASVAKQRLKEWVKKNGPVYIAGGAWQIRKYGERFCLNIDLLQEKLKKHGIPVEQAIVPSYEVLKPYLSGKRYNREIASLIQRSDSRFFESFRFFKNIAPPEQNNMLYLPPPTEEDTE